MRNDKLGVFVCDCGNKIADSLDLEALVESASGWPGVVYAGRAPYWCSADGRERLQATIQAEGLERVVVAGCSPRTHKHLFQETVSQAGLNPNLLGLVNIREGCAWPHQAEPRAATARAYDQIRMEVAHTAALTPRPTVQTEITPAALVIGGGVAGMTAALELVDAAIPVTLVERTETLGGTTLTDAPELAAELISAVQTHPSITLHLNSHLTQVDGSVGAYYVTTQHTANLHQSRDAQETGNTQHATRNTQHGPFGTIIIATGTPDEETDQLARLLRLPQDTEGFFPEWRVRLRPGHYVERGIYVCGSAHYPCEATEAQFQAYSTASRALRYLGQGHITASGPAAQVAPEKCNGCGDCFQVCPFAAVTMVERSDGQYLESVEELSLSLIDPLLCTGCGNCVSVCPVGAVTVAGWTDAQLEAQMEVALGRESANTLPGTGQRIGKSANGESRILIFACEWSGYAAAELAGAQKLAYPANVRMIRLDCTGRLQPGLILKAFELGATGVLVLGCAPKLCHYERGNERAAAAYAQVEALTGLLGLPPARLQLAWIPPDDGPAFVELVTEFVKGVEETVGCVPAL